MSSEETIITAAIAMRDNGDTITDLQARVIASLWHGGQSSPLYALTSSGAIVDGVFGEIDGCSAHADTVVDEQALEGLRLYVDRHGERGPVDGWSELSW